MAHYIRSVTTLKFNSWPRPNLRIRNQQPDSITHTQKNSRGPQERPVIGSQGRDESRNIPEKSSPFIFTARRQHHPDSSGPGAPRDGKRYPGLNIPEVSSGGALHTHQSAINHSPTKPAKHESPEPKPTLTTLPQWSSLEGAIRQVPSDIIDLTLDSSDDEYPDTPGQSTSTNSNNLARPPSEVTSNNHSIPEFSTGSAILRPTLGIVKKPRDKPRLFVRYSLGSESYLANISAHGFVDQICMVPQW
jgi:hypothetical protein